MATKKKTAKLVKKEDIFELKYGNYLKEFRKKEKNLENSGMEKLEFLHKKLETFSKIDF